MLGTVNPFSNCADEAQGSRMFRSPQFLRELNCELAGMGEAFETIHGRPFGGHNSEGPAWL